MTITRKYAWMRTAAGLLTALLASSAVVSCVDDDTEPPMTEQTEIVEPAGPDMPSEERIDVPVAIIGGDGSGLYAALTKRCAEQGEISSPTIGAVIVASHDLDANTAAIMTAYDTGAIIIVTNPDDNQVAAWCTDNDINYIGDGDSNVGDKHLLYCFNNHDDHYLLDDFISEMPDCDYETALNSFTTWVNTHSLKARSQANDTHARPVSRNGSDVDIAKTFASQTVTHTYNIGIKDGELAHVLWSSADKLTKNSTIDVSYEIYPLHSFDANLSAGDFYIVQASATVHNAPMFKGQWTKKHGGVHARLGGFYLSRFNLDATFCSVKIDCSSGKRTYTEYANVSYPAGATPVPESSVGSTTYQSGFSWSLNGSLSGGFKGKEPTGQITLGGNFGWSNSESRNISDVTIEKNAPNNQAGYVFKINNLPHTSKGKLHTDIPTVAKSDFTTYQSWIWYVPDAKDYSDPIYGMKVYASVEYKGYHWYSSASDFSEKTFSNALPESERRFCIPFTVPNRVPHGRLVLVNNSRTHQYLHSIKIWKSRTPSTANPDYIINQTVASSYSSSSTATSSATLSLPVGKYRIQAVRCNISQSGEEYDKMTVESANDVEITLANDTNVDGGGIDFKPKK